MFGRISELAKGGDDLASIRTNLAEAAAAGVHEGILAVGPLKVTGATGSPINPILIG